MRTWIRRSLQTGLVACALLISGVGVGHAEEATDVELPGPVTSVLSGTEAGSAPAETNDADAAQGSVTITSEGSGEPVQAEDCPCDDSAPKPEPPPVVDSDEGCDCDLTVGTPAVEGQSAGAPGSAKVPAGEQATVVVPVTNTGSTNLSSLRASGPGGPMTCAADSLAVGESTACRGSFAPTEGASSAPVTVTATTASGDPAEATGTLFVTGTAGTEPAPGSGAGSAATGDGSSGSPAGSVTVGSSGGFPIPVGSVEAGAGGHTAEPTGLVALGIGLLLGVAAFLTVATRRTAVRRS
ncbi:MAG: hypothetical protein ACRDQ7_00725 [Haloechinothrix sp.]